VTHVDRQTPPEQQATGGTNEAMRALEEIMARTHCETYFNDTATNKDCTETWPGQYTHWCIACLAQCAGEALSPLVGESKAADVEQPAPSGDPESSSFQPSATRRRADHEEEKR
jgi:hypothetical protein